MIMDNRLKKLKLAQTWDKLGIFAHGNLMEGKTFHVPNDIAIVFATHPGDVCLDPLMNYIAMSHPLLDDMLFQKGVINTKQGKKPLYSVAYLPGDVCPDMTLDFVFDDYPEGIWRLPVPLSFKHGVGGVPKTVLSTAVWKEQQYVTLSYAIHMIIKNASFFKRPSVVYVLACRWSESPSWVRDVAKMNAAVSTGIEVGLTNPGNRSASVSKINPYLRKSRQNYKDDSGEPIYGPYGQYLDNVSDSLSYDFSTMRQRAKALDSLRYSNTRRNR